MFYNVCPIQSNLKSNKRLHVPCARIQALTEEGLTSNDIALQLERPEAGIRNLRHRMKLKTTTKETAKSLRQDIRQLKHTKARLTQNVASMERRHREVSKSLQVDEARLKERLTIALTKMKDQKPELFQITLEEQIGKLAGEITLTFLKWIVS